MNGWRSTGEDGDVMSGAEPAPELSVIVHGRIVKGSRELVKKIVGGQKGLKVGLDICLVDCIQKIKEFNFIPRGET